MGEPWLCTETWAPRGWQVEVAREGTMGGGPEEEDTSGRRWGGWPEEGRLREVLALGRRTMGGGPEDKEVQGRGSEKEEGQGGPGKEMVWGRRTRREGDLAEVQEMSKGKFSRLQSSNMRGGAGTYPWQEVLQETELGGAGGPGKGSPREGGGPGEVARGRCPGKEVLWGRRWPWGCCLDQEVAESR